MIVGYTKVAPGANGERGGPGAASDRLHIAEFA